MSLKEFTKELFTRYGFTENDIIVYLTYLRVPRACMSEVFLSLEEEHEITYEQVEEVTNDLVEKGFLKKVEGIVDRFIPLEPYLELFTTESTVFRDEIAKIKDAVLADQSTRFEKLEAIQDKSITEVETAVDAQIKDFYEDSDIKNTNKKERIDSARNRFTDTTKTLEKDLHSIKDLLNTDLKNISNSFISDNEGGINTAKDNITKIIAELLGDFSKRLEELEKELKQSLDGHVERHVNIANELKPKMEQILEKYLERMDRVVTELKDKISNILKEHITHVQNTTNNLQTDLKSKVDNRHGILNNQSTTFKNNALTLIDNLVEISNRFSDLAEDLAGRGAAFKSLFFGKHKKYKARYSQVKEDIDSIARPMKDDFVTETDQYISDTQATTNELKNEITDDMSRENQTLGTETTDLDHKAQETINVQLETLATDMAGEIDNTLQGGVKDCSDTSIKLKDSLEKTLKQHHEQYDNALNRHKEDSLRHYTDFDTEIKRKNESWVRDIDEKFTGGKSNVSEKIDSEITLWNDESADMDKNLSDMLEDHKSKYEVNAKTLQGSLSNTTRDTIQNVKDAIADFTLQFMNSIDDSTEVAELNEEKLKDISTASSSIPEISKLTTWHTVGRKALVSAMRDAIYRVKSSIIIITPKVIPEVLQLISEHAYTKQAARFMITSHWDMQAYGGIIKKMQGLGNIQFRQLNTAGEYYAMTRDAEEVILCPATEKEADMIAVISNQAGYAKLYSQFIGPIFQANSRPVKL